MAANILVVDDDPKITQLLKRVLSLEGYSVQTASSGADGLDEARSQDPDLVILDVLMPGMDGIEVCRRIRSEGDTPVLLLTAKDEVSDRVKGLDSGADDYVVKPFALEELLARVRVLLRRHEAAVGEILRFEDVTLDTGSRTAAEGAKRSPCPPPSSSCFNIFCATPDGSSPAKPSCTRSGATSSIIQRTSWMSMSDTCATSWRERAVIACCKRCVGPDMC